MDKIKVSMIRLENIWRQVPSQRLGQFLYNILREYYAETHRDPFFPDDDDFLDTLEKLYWIGEKVHD